MWKRSSRGMQLTMCFYERGSDSISTVQAIALLADITTRALLSRIPSLSLTLIHLLCQIRVEKTRQRANCLLPSSRLSLPQLCRPRSDQRLQRGKLRRTMPSHRLPCAPRRSFFHLPLVPNELPIRSVSMTTLRRALLLETGSTGHLQRQVLPAYVVRVPCGTLPVS